MVFSWLFLKFLAFQLEKKYKNSKGTGSPAIPEGEPVSGVDPAS